MEIITSNTKNQIHSFYNSKQLGDKGESEFLRNYPQYRLNTTIDVKETDFIGRIFGIKAELKSDSYTSTNFFMERWSDVEGKKPGGPWQAIAKGANWYVYWFINSPNRYYWISLTTENIIKLDQLYREYERKESVIQNRNYQTVGKALPIQLVMEALTGSYIDEIGAPYFKFFSGYVGSKRMWIEVLKELKGLNFIELFAGSAALSANLANHAILNDKDSYVAKILSNFDQQIVSNSFTIEEYKTVRTLPNWWQYSFCLQKMAFSGVFRYSKNGYNVPPKPEGSVNMKEVEEEYRQAYLRWKQLQPEVLNISYEQVPKEKLLNRILVMDPPYFGAMASYNNKEFDYEKYWKYIEEVKDTPLVLVIFDKKENLINKNLPIFAERKMRVNGAKSGSIEAMSLYTCGKWLERDIIEVYGNEADKGA